MSELTKDLVLEMYRIMKTSRFSADELLRLTQEGLTRGAPHMNYGEEAAGVGVGLASSPEDDYFMPHHRGVAQCLARKMDLGKQLSGFCGRLDGFSRGRTTPAQSYWKQGKMLPSNGIIGTNASLCVGAALAMKYKKMPGVVFCLFGDGGTNQGLFHEALNLASVWKLPVLFVCVNNQFAISTRSKDSFAPASVADFAAVYGMESIKIDGNDVIGVYQKASELRESIVRNAKPAFLELETYRLGGHYIGDDENYRTKEEVKEHWLRDPILLLEQWIEKNQSEWAAELPAVEEEAREATRKAVEFALASPFPTAEGFMDWQYIKQGPAWERRVVNEDDYSQAGN